MTFLPVVERELRMAARRRGTYWMRLLFAVGCAGVSGLMLMIAWAARGGASAIGGGLFYFLALVTLGFSGFAGVFLTSDCLSEERREGTLGLLFLTDLKGYDVVLGKLMATSVTAFYGVLAVFPVLALTLTMGGVTPGEFWRMTLVFMTTLFFSLAAAMFVSALSHQENRAMTGAAALILFVGAGLPLIEFGLAQVGFPMRSAVALPSPVTAWRLAFDSSYRMWGRSFWASLLWTHGLSWAFLVSASVLLPRLWRPGEGMLSGAPWRTVADEIALAKQSATRARLLDVNPVFWLTNRRSGWWWTGLVSTLLGIGLLVGLGGVAAPVMLLSVPFASLLLTAPVRIEVGVQASRFFSETRRNGALELLLCTALTTQDLISGQWLTLRRRFLAPVAVVSGLVLVLMFFSFAGVGSDFIFVVLFAGGKCLFLLAAFIADVFAAGWIGMLVGLTAKKPAHAPGLTVLYTVALPALAFCVPDLVLAVPLIFWARDKLQWELRAMSSPRYAPVTPLYSRGQPPAPQPPIIRG